MSNGNTIRRLVLHYQTGVRVLFGQAGGPLITIDGSGHIHVDPPGDPWFDQAGATELVSALIETGIVSAEQVRVAARSL
jgi:hypothetical protein